MSPINYTVQLSENFEQGLWTFEDDSFDGAVVEVHLVRCENNYPTHVCNRNSVFSDSSLESTGPRGYSVSIPEDGQRSATAMVPDSDYPAFMNGRCSLVTEELSGG